MERRFKELADLRSKYNAPIFYGGDIFHSWREPAELVNFVIKQLPPGYAIAGQHDLPYHRYGDIRKSPYWTLVEADKIINLGPMETRHINSMLVSGFPWGTTITSQYRIKPNPGVLSIALIHHYVWSSTGTGYAGAPPESKADVLAQKLKGFEAAFFGDNHKMHYGRYSEDGPTIVNPGCFIRQKSDERDSDAWAALLSQDGSVTAYPFDNSQDKFLDISKDDENFEEMDTTAEQVIKEITQYVNDTVDFHESIKRILSGRKEVRDSVRAIILRALEDSQ